MSKAPSMPMYWDAYIADTTHLSCEEHGAYLMLLGAMWRRNGWVPDNDKDNARILGLTPAKWRKIKERLKPFLIIENDHITQEKLLKTWGITQEKIAKNKLNGAKGGRAASSKNNNLDQANAKNSLKRKATIPEPEPIDTNVSLLRDAQKQTKPDMFQIFWDTYPHRNGAKKGRAKAEASYARHFKAGISEQEIIDGAKRYARDRQVVEGYAKDPTTWLNQRSWEDDVEPYGNSKHSTGDPKERWSKMI